ncbi:KTSC domain-containing protein [Dyadobacter luticola]|uniref:KTSC domain-containing protein n=1 Tax=Dyadobacter luticola TaxID=1979387 RepID=A0A5R9L3Z5_9BACT|nr:KTSC domain-containing protein [Dyadobacter luticola]TLV03286.1 KTSC domain-containing protein [Dyadobacter luticola]
MPSSVSSKFIYDGDTETLRVIYVSGMVYDYKKVPLEVYQAMTSAFSKGTFLNRYIKGNYEFEKVND